MRRFVLLLGVTTFMATAAVVYSAPRSGVKSPAQSKMKAKAPVAANVKLPPVKPVTAATIRQQIAAQKGKVVFVNFWATWCAPCRQELPDLVRLQRKYAKQGLVVIFVSADDEADIKTKVQPFLRTSGANASWIIQGSLSDFIEQYEPKLEDAFDLPRNYLFNRDGQQVEVFGEVDLKEAEAKIKGLLSQGSTTQERS